MSNMTPETGGRELFLLGLFGPGVLERDRAVENRLSRSVVFIQGEVAQALKLVAYLGGGFPQRRLAFGGDYLKGVRVQMFLEVPVRVGFRDQEQPVVQA